MTQWYPLEIIEYRIRILPIIRELLEAHPEVTQPWCVDNTRSRDCFWFIKYHLEELMQKLLAHGYFTYSTKILLVISYRNIPKLRFYSNL